MIELGQRREQPAGDGALGPAGAGRRREGRRELGAWLSRVVRPRIGCFGRSLPAYGLFVVSGTALGMCFALAIAVQRGLSVAACGVLLTAAVVIALILAYGTRALTGHERFTFYHYQLSAIAGVALIAGLSGLAILSYLDLLALGLAVAQSFGRIGCLMAGCCHGRPAVDGVCYGDAHAADGLSPRVVGIPLLPVQAVESGANLLLLAGGAALVAGHAPAGSALALYLIGYAVVRFATESLRGDSRPRLAGLSEARWTSMAVLASTAGAGSYLLGSSPLLAASVVAVCALGVVSLCAARGSMPSCALLDGAHQTEVAILSRELDGAAERDAQAIRVRTTSQGLRLSKGTPGGAELYTFSHTGRELDERSAQVTARTLLAISAYPSGELLRGEAGIWHLLVQPR